MLVRTTRALATCLILCATSGLTSAEVHLSASLSSDYAHRGLRQTIDGPSVQGLLEYQFSSGWYVGAWAGNLDFDRPGDRDFELDYFVGYNRRVNPDLAFDVTLIRYTYPGQNDVRNYDWQELITSAYLGDRWLVSLGVAHNWLAQDKPTAFAEAGYRHPMPLGLTLDVTVGWQALPRPFPNYVYGELGVSRHLGPVDVRLGYGAVEDAAKDRFGKLAADRWIATLTYSL